MKYVSTRLRMTAIAAALLAFTTMMMVPTGALAAPTLKLQLSSCRGTSAAGDVLNGVVTITSFAAQGNQLIAQGLLNGTLTSATGAVTPIVNQTVNLPVSSSSASCEILPNLVLGPLDLDLLGLTIHPNQVVLNIAAIPGNGNLLGTLLCGVARLLDGTNLNGVLNPTCGLAQSDIERTLIR